MPIERQDAVLDRASEFSSQNSEISIYSAHHWLEHANLSQQQIDEPQTQRDDCQRRPEWTTFTMFVGGRRGQLGQFRLPCSTGGGGDRAQQRLISRAEPVFGRGI